MGGLRLPHKFLPMGLHGEFFPPTNHHGTNEELNHQCLPGGKYCPCTQTYSLSSDVYAFMRNDAHRVPLTHPCCSPYLILKCNTKAFCLQIHGQEDWVSIDGLKPTYLKEDDPSSTNHQMLKQHLYLPQHLRGQSTQLQWNHITKQLDETHQILRPGCPHSRDKDTCSEPPQQSRSWNKRPPVCLAHNHN